VLALVNQKRPPTINLDNADPECGWTMCRTQRSTSFDVALSKLIWFGGINRYADHAKGGRSDGLGRIYLKQSPSTLLRAGFDSAEVASLQVNRSVFQYKENGGESWSGIAPFCFLGYGN